MKQGQIYATESSVSTGPPHGGSDSTMVIKGSEQQ